MDFYSGDLRTAPKVPSSDPISELLTGKDDMSYVQKEEGAVMTSPVEPGGSGTKTPEYADPGGDRPAGFGKNRIEALTDGVFAIALTLLVLGVEVPPFPEEMVPATQLLINLIPDFFHYILAFIVLAVIWVFHHQQFHHILRIDRTMLAEHPCPDVHHHGPILLLFCRHIL